MKILLFAAYIISSYILFAQNSHSENTEIIAKNHIILKGNHQQIINKEAYLDKTAKDTLFYVFTLAPKGFIVISSNTYLRPVIAFSFINNIDSEEQLINLLQNDISLRIKQLALIPESVKQKNKTEWNNLLSENPIKEKNQLWPPAGTSPTGGWLESNWSQNAPYKNMCPMDPIDSTRCVAGCPAVAMSMIVNYHQNTNNVFFSDLDDYYHNYAGRQYWIDDDYLSIDFPSFSQLNTYLDTLDAHYINQFSLSNDDMAALVFACGVACKQVYTSSIAGTFGVAQALDAYYKFNFNNIEILYDGDTTIHTRLISNMKDSMPAHLALVDSAGTIGHNVVVDGYDSDGFFHINFGWGGSANAWYDLPTTIPYSLNVIEGVIVDIKTNTVTYTEENLEHILSIFPNPATNYINIEFLENINSDIKIYNSCGELVYKSQNANTQAINIDVSSYSKGVYFVEISLEKRCVIKKFILQ